MTVSQTLSQYVADAAPVLGTLLVAVVTCLAARATAWVNAHAKNALVTGFMDRLRREVDAGVAATEQTVVANLKPADGGSLTPADAARAKQAAEDLVLANLGGDKWIAEAKKILGEADIKAFLASRIEAAVHSMSQWQTIPDAPPAAVAVAQVSPALAAATTTAPAAP